MSGVELIETTVKAVEAVLEQQTVKMPDLWEESWRPKLGPSQYRHDLSLHVKHNCFNEKFEKDLHEEFNKISPELQETVSTLEQLVYLNYIRCLYECGWKPTLGEIFTKDEIQKMLNIQPKFSKLLSHILRILEEENFLKNVGTSTWQVVQFPPTMSQVENQLSSSHLNDELVKRFDFTLILQKVGEKYSGILTGKHAATPLLLPEEGPSLTLTKFYRDYGTIFKTTKLSSSVITQHLKYLKSQNTTKRKLLRVLEIGAGAGALTTTFIEAMVKEGIEFKYTFTDISPNFFVTAEKLLEPHLQHIKFKKLNIEEDPMSQGFTSYYYDWIIASDVVHETRNLEESFANVRNLLRDGGTFDLVEQTKVNRIATFLSGLLDSFWRFEDFELRPNHCTISDDKWIETLQNCGFKLAGSFPCLNNSSAYISTYKSPNLNDMIRFESRRPVQNKLWILFHFDDSPISNYISSLIPTLDNRQVVVVRRGEKFRQLKNDDGWRFELSQESEQDFCQLMNYLESCRECKIEGIVWCWSLDKSCTTQEVVMRPYFNMIKSVLKLRQRESPKITAFVNGVVPVEDNDMSHFPLSTIWGFNKALRNERTELAVRSVDIGGREDEKSVAEQAFYELWNDNDKEAQVAYHENVRYIPKIQPFKPSLTDLKLPSGSDMFKLILPETKAIEDLQFGPLDPIVLGKTEVEVKVKASALNFKDVFNVLKPSDDFKQSNAVGFDFAGVVKRVGSKVTRWVVGDTVFGVNTNNSALPNHLKLDENDLCQVPTGMTLPDACTLPAVYATSYYCLIEVANITPQDTVLIHTASGGVGLSAIQICKSIGAKVIATAGSKRKQNYLRSLGIQHVFHSRNTNYGDEILRVTNGFGVTVVLNSLTSEGFKEATLRACAKGARFVEMSKLSIWQPEDVKKLRPDVQYTIVDLSSMDRSEWNRLMGELVRMLANKVAKPIPYVRFDTVHVREALHFLQKAKHIGKVVCVMPDFKQKDGESEICTPMFNASATYLITGGLGGIGFVVCQWMMNKGAKYVLLAGRNPPTEIMQQSVDKLNMEYKSNVRPVHIDVGDFSQCKELVQDKIPDIGFPALRGVMHAAGVLRDGLVENQTWENLTSTFGSKVEGTLNLHELTKDLNLEFFVLFSSVVSMFGSGGQSNYSAANQFEDAFAHYRHSIGLPATSVNWGQWSEVGMATEVDLPGIKPFSNIHGLAGLEYVLKSQRTQIGVINIDSFTHLAKLYPYVSSVFDERLWKLSNFSLCSANNTSNLNSDEFWQQYNSLDDINSRKKYLRDLLCRILHNVLKLDVTDVIEVNGNFQEMGVDSLMFVEMKNAVQHLLGNRAVVNISTLKDCNTITSFADVLLKIIEGEDLQDSNSNVEEVAQLIEQDCQLAEHIKSNPKQKRVEIKDISTVLLTGCSGTLGVYVLRELTKSSQVAQVICLMRPSKQMSGEDRLEDILKKREILSEIDMGKIRCVTGNVAEYKFGMDSALWDELSNDVDAVFHCAAKVNHVEHYRKRDDSVCDVRKVNVGGLKNVLEFACSGDKLKHINCASSMLAVPKLGKDGNVPEEWPEPNQFDGVTTLAYPISKYVEDMLMKEAVTERGIPGKVFRFPLITGDSKTGKFLLENNHMMLRYIFILKSGIMPDFHVPFPLLSVDICAWAFTQISLDPHAPHEVFNMCNKCPDLDKDFVHVAKQLGYNVDLVDFSEFNKQFRAFAVENFKFDVFDEFYKNDDDIRTLRSGYEWTKWALDGGSDKNFMVSKKIAKILPEFYSENKCSGNELYRDMLYAKKQGWFEKFGIIGNIPVNNEKFTGS